MNATFCCALAALAVQWDASDPARPELWAEPYRSAVRGTTEPSLFRYVAPLSPVLAGSRAEPAWAHSLSAAPPRFWTASTWHTLDRSVIRGQSPGTQVYDENPAATDRSAPSSEAFVPPQTSPGLFGSPFGQPAPQPYPYDPFLGQPPQEGLGYVDPFGPQSTYGVYGPQPYRLGWMSRYDAGFLFQESTRGVPGSFEVIETNAALRYSNFLTPTSIFSWTPEFNYRGWEGPGGVALPGSVYRFASDFEITAVGASPWSLQLGFTPQIVSDFEQELDSDGYSFDGRGILFYRASPQWLLAFGAGFWDRVKDRVIPYAGVVWTPDDRWEFRLLFPKSRISLFLGNVGGSAVWFYGSGEFNVEAYEVALEDTGRQDRIELSDWRLLLGLRSEAWGISSFVEGGWVLDRQVRFKGPTTDFDIADGFLIRAGIRF